MKSRGVQINWFKYTLDGWRIQPSAESLSEISKFLNKGYELQSLCEVDIF